jgi:hypothetical protein
MIYKALATAFIIIGALAALYYVVAIIAVLMPSKRRFYK